MFSNLSFTLSSSQVVQWISSQLLEAQLMLRIKYWSLSTVSVKPRLKLWCHGAKAERHSLLGQFTRSATTPHSSTFVITMSATFYSTTTPAPAITHWAARGGKYSYKVEYCCPWLERNCILIELLF